jgi:glycosyltransferase involved in cell wall biosynthesis
LKILHVPNAYFPVIGGTERNCQRLSEVLTSLGHDVRVITTDVGSVEGYYKFGVPRVERQNDNIGGVSVTRLPFSNALYQFGGWAETSLPSWLSNRLTGRTMEFLRYRLADMMTRQITQIRPDVVMTMPHLVVNVEAVLAARRRVQFPLVMVPMLHEHDPNWNARAMSEALSSADAVVALTACEVDRLSNAYGVPHEKIFLAMVGVDPVDRPIGKRYQQVIFLGRKAKSKGIGELIAAMEYVWRACPDVELLIAGARTSETLEIDQQIGSLPDYWRRLVKDLGAVSETGKDELFRRACCLVLPSKVESFGMVILDAWAHATPVIAWDLPVFRSIIEDGRTGLLVDPSGGSRAIGEAILRVLQDMESAARMGFAGYRQIQTVYSWQMVADVYLKAYEYAMRHAKLN